MGVSSWRLLYLLVHEEIDHLLIVLFCEMTIPRAGQVHGGAGVAHHLSIQIIIPIQPKGEILLSESQPSLSMSESRPASTTQLLDPTPGISGLSQSIGVDEKVFSDARAT